MEVPFTEMRRSRDRERLEQKCEGGLVIKSTVFAWLSFRHLLDCPVKKVGYRSLQVSGQDKVYSHTSEGHSMSYIQSHGIR